MNNTITRLVLTIPTDIESLQVCLEEVERYLQVVL